MLRHWAYRSSRVICSSQQWNIFIAENYSPKDTVVKDEMIRRLQEYLHAYAEAAGIASDLKGYFFRTANGTPAHSQKIL
jgi:hypothetical protein